MKRSYTVILHRAEDGWWVANVPMLRATAQGRTRSTALKRARSLIGFALETIRKEGSKPPSEESSNLNCFSPQAGKKWLTEQVINSWGRIWRNR